MSDLYSKRGQSLQTNLAPAPPFVRWWSSSDHFDAAKKFPPPGNMEKPGGRACRDLIEERAIK
jgi:hypothetical protein